MSEKRDRVLLVEDESSVRRLVRAGLARRGFQVTDVEDGAAALERFRAERPDIVVLDAMMPGMDGFALCRAIRALADGGQVPIVMLSAFDDEVSIARARDSGATDFCVKSSQMTLLAERIRGLLRSARARK